MQLNSTAQTKTMLSQHHSYSPKANQCSSTLIQNINAPLPLIWSILRRFDQPQAHESFIRTCTMLSGDGAAAGSVREVALVSGLPGRASRERLDRLDDDMHVMICSVIDGDQRLENFRSTTTVHEEEEDGGGTVVIKSYVVDVPEGNSEEDTRVFVDTLLGCNLRSLASVAEKLACNA